MIELPQVTEHWKNLSLIPLSEVYEGELYVEEWRPIDEYEGKYEISSFGRVKSLNYAKTNKEGILGQCKMGTGYLRVDLTKKTNHKFIHILVANAFIPNPENKPEVNHKKGIKTDNRVHQLEWATKSEQMLHAIHVLGFVPINPPTPLKGKLNPKSKKIKQIDKNTGEVIKIFDATMDAQRETGISNSAIVAAAKGKYHTAGGFQWAYA